MDHPPAGLHPGDRLSQADIEALFDTGFGYQISGINPRRDDDEQRYVLLFSHEDGPYADEIGTGEFRYIGEGLEGDQSETSPGNAVLIDAITNPIPIYFFYKGSADTRWQYRGQVRVRGYEREEHGGREVLVFTMQQKDEREAISGLYLIPVSDEWIEQFERTVATPLRLAQEAPVPAQFEGMQDVRVWGTTETDSPRKQRHIEQLEPGDYVLFYHDGEFVATGRVGRFFEDPTVGEWLWGRTESRYIFTLDEYRDAVPAIDTVWEMLGYDGRQVVQGFRRVKDDRVARLVREYGSIGSVLFEQTDESPESEPTEDEIEREKTALEQAVDSEPQLTEDTEYVERRQKAREHAFRELVRDAYDNTCAVCGKHRESPDGNPEVEAAHIYPKSEEGRDDVRNGIALCKLHHWCFDVGWITITDDYKIRVPDAPERTGYYEFKQLDGDSLHLPGKDQLKPHTIFIEARRELRGS